MKYLWPEWPSLFQRLKQAKHRLYLFDVDGTLSPIVKNLSRARVDKRLQTKLRRLSSQKKTAVGILSGRSLATAQKMVRVSSLIYGGNHGLEIKGAGRLFVHPLAKNKKALIKKAQQLLRRPFRSIPCLIFENKGLSLSVHFRRLSRQAQARFRRQFMDFIRLQKFMRGMKVREGKCVFEILPKTKWNKGSALKFIRKRIPTKSIVLFAGDDHTDEDAFAALGKNDIGIQVGRNSKSQAAYYLKDQKEVRRLLTELCEI